MLDFELNLNHHDEPGTLVPSRHLEKRLDLRLVPRRSKCMHTIATRFAINIHAFYLEELSCLLDQLSTTDFEGDLLITTDTEEKRTRITQLIQREPGKKRINAYEVIVANNQGRNVVPLLKTIWPKLEGYTAVLHLHTKRHIHQPQRGAVWFQDLQQCLIGNQGELRSILSGFVHNPSLGVVIPRPAEAIRPYCYWGSNFHVATTLCESIQYEHQLSWNAPLIFPAGMMFWFRPAALQPLANMLDRLETLPAEPLPSDGTALHALERLVLHSCELAGLEWNLCSPSTEWEENTSLTPHRISLWTQCPNEYAQSTAKMAAERHSLQRKFEAVQNRLNELHNSQSWKLTKPLRNVKRLFRSLY